MNIYVDYDVYVHSELVMESVPEPVDRKSLISHPVNCKSECPYGRDRAFCFPCMKKILEEHKALRKDR